MNDNQKLNSTTNLIVGFNNVKWKDNIIKFEVRQVETIFSGLCHVILLSEVSSKAGDRYIFKLTTNVSLVEDQVRKIKLQFSSNDAFLDIVWKGMNGIHTLDYELKLGEYENLIVFYKEIRNQ